MGCSFNKTAPCPENNVIKMISTRSSLAFRSSASPSIDVFKSNTPKCLKVSIKPENSEDWDYNIALIEEFSVPCSSEIQYLHKIYSIFESLLGYFEKTIHRCCIRKYNFKKGIEILIVYASVSQNYQELVIESLAEKPFLRATSNISGTNSEIIKSFNKLTEFLTDFTIITEIDKAIEHIKNVFSNLVVLTLKQNSKRVIKIGRILKLILGIGYQTKNEIKKYHDELEYVSKNFEKVCDGLSCKIDSCFGLNVENIEKLVHSLFQ